MPTNQDKSINTSITPEEKNKNAQDIVDRLKKVTTREDFENIKKEYDNMDKSNINESAVDISMKAKEEHISNIEAVDSIREELRNTTLDERRSNETIEEEEFFQKLKSCK